MEYAYANVDPYGGCLVQWGERGGNVTLRCNDVYWADDPLVQTRPDLFSSTPIGIHSTIGREPLAPTPIGETKRRGKRG